jgi:hypothetical protein
MQALNIMNDPVFIEAAQFFARKYPSLQGKAYIEKAYQDMFGVPISTKKTGALLQFYEKMEAYYAANPKETLAFLRLCPDNSVPAEPARLVAKTLLANTLFNIDESINKP